jgi:predicted nucleic-acid-binding protein
MPYKMIKFAQEIEAVDIPTMHSMSIEEYGEYIKDRLFFVDHHDILRSGIADYPIATSKEQFDVLIKHLSGYRDRLL